MDIDIGLDILSKQELEEDCKKYYNNLNSTIKAGKYNICKISFIYKTDLTKHMWELYTATCIEFIRHWFKKENTFFFSSLELENKKLNCYIIMESYDELKKSIINTKGIKKFYNYNYNFKREFLNYINNRGLKVVNCQLIESQKIYFFRNDNRKMIIKAVIVFFVCNYMYLFSNFIISTILFFVLYFIYNYLDTLGGKRKRW